MNAKCFLITATDQVQRHLRRYSAGHRMDPDICPVHPGQYSYHDAKVPLDVIAETERLDVTRLNEGLAIPKDDPRWPKACECGYVFEPRDEWQVFTQHLYRRDSGELMTLRDAPAGAMWYADWMIHKPDQAWGRGPDGHCLMIKGFFNDEFCPDNRASNCTLPNDDNHKCWIRVGEVPNITIGKSGGPTCGAGAGSFFFGRLPEGGFRWHGFLIDGTLVEA